MSQVEQSELPERVPLNITRADQIERWHETRRAIAESRGVSPDDLTRPDVLDTLLDAYEFQRLQEDQRIREAKHAVADDHNVSPDDVTLRSLLKLTSGAYLGYQQTSDWRPSENGEQSGGQL